MLIDCKNQGIIIRRAFVPRGGSHYHVRLILCWFFCQRLLSVDLLVFCSVRRAQGVQRHEAFLPLQEGRRHFSSWQWGQGLHEGPADIREVKTFFSNEIATAVVVSGCLSPPSLVLSEQGLFLLSGCEAAGGNVLFWCVFWPWTVN